MIIKWGLIMLPLALLATVGSASPQAFGISSVHVESAGVWVADPNGQQTRQDCMRFKLGDKAARRWFHAAHEVSQPAWLENAEWTQCSATGTLVTRDGRVYSWSLDQSGRGKIIITPTVSVYLSGPELPVSVR